MDIRGVMNRTWESLASCWCLSKHADCAYETNQPVLIIPNKKDFPFVPQSDCD